MKERVNGLLRRFYYPIAALVSIALPLLLAYYNIDKGPLSNLHDIGGWRNRALYIALTAAVHLALMALCALSCGKKTERFILRGLLLTAGVFLMQKGINQKAYAYVEVLQPIIRQMDHGGLAAGLAADSYYSAPMLTLLYWLTRGPVYDMYMVKLLCTAAYLCTCLILTKASDRHGNGLRSTGLLLLCVILPQGFISAACSAQPEIVSVCLLAGAAYGMERGGRGAVTALSGVLLGLACSLSGIGFYALLPLLYLRRKNCREWLIPAGAALMLALVPGWIAGGIGVTGSLFRANLSEPAFALGTPGLLGMIPRALVNETPGYFMLRRLPELTLTETMQECYTTEHFMLLTRGFTWILLGFYGVVCAYTVRSEKQDPFTKGLTLVLCALMVCPCATASGWLAVGLLCLYVLIFRPELRLPCAVQLFACAGTAAMAFTGETLLPLVIAGGMSLCVLLMGVLPYRKENTLGQ